MNTHETYETPERDFRTVGGTDGRNYEVDADGIARRGYRDAELIFGYRHTAAEEAELNLEWFGPA